MRAVIVPVTVVLAEGSTLTTEQVAELLGNCLPPPEDIGDDFLAVVVDRDESLEAEVAAFDLDEDEEDEEE